MADDSAFPAAASGIEIGTSDVVLTSVGRGTISVNDYVTWPDEAGVALFGTVRGFAPGDNMMFAIVLPDGGSDSVQVDVRSMSKVKRPLPSTAAANPEPQVEAALLDRLTAEVVDRVIAELGFIQGPDGRFLGSEPEGGKDNEGDGKDSGEGDGSAGGAGTGGSDPFADADGASALDSAGDWSNFDQGAGGWQDFETPDASTVESVFLSGGEPTEIYTQVTGDGGMGMAPIESLSDPDAERAIDAVDAQMSDLAVPAPADVTITTLADVGGYSYNPDTGMLQSPYGSESATLPSMATPSNIVGYGNPSAALDAAAQSGGTGMAVQITVPEGTPIINGGVGTVADASAGTAVMVPGSPSVTVTGMAVHPDTGQPMLLATVAPKG